MVNYGKLKSKRDKPKEINPTEIFRRLPKPEGIIDLHASQKDILQEWFNDRDNKDIIIKLHTGGGKTIAGLLIAQSTINESGEPVLYLTSTKQLVDQTIKSAEQLGIDIVRYTPGEPLNENFKNGKAIMVGTYKSLFNGKSKFGIREDNIHQRVGAIIVDDAHSAFPVVRESFTLEISGEDYNDLYFGLVDLFRKSFKDIDKLGTLEDVVSDSDNSVLEIPYWAWNEKLDVVREHLKSYTHEFPLVWPLLRDHLHMCHALISKKSITITPLLPLINLFPTFHDAPRRIYMSATITDDSEILRTFDAEYSAINSPLESRSLAGISEKMILIPELTEVEYEKEHSEKILKWISRNDLGSVVLTPSDYSAKKWGEEFTIANGSSEVERLVTDMQEKRFFGPLVLANRYDGLDLPGDSCRILFMDGLPTGTSNYELFIARALQGDAFLSRKQAQRIEQGIGRGARGSGDYCVVVLVGKDIVSWVSNNSNFNFLTSETKAQLDIGKEISNEIKSLKDLAETIKDSIERKRDWVEYHADTLAELVDKNLDKEESDSIYELAKVERKAFNLWNDRQNAKAISKIEKLIDNKSTVIDSKMTGWMQQFAARIADSWGNQDRAIDLQKEAYSNNRNLMRPIMLPPYRRLEIPSSQAKKLVENIGGYRYRLGYLRLFEETVSKLNKESTANQFEQSLVDLAEMIGLSAERYDAGGRGPDVLWLLPNKIGFVIEAKSRKRTEKPLTKNEHGQLLVASEWFSEKYPEYRHLRVSVHPESIATEAAVAKASYALTYQNLMLLVSDAREIIESICHSQLGDEDLESECNHLLSTSNIKSERIADNYLVPFENESEK